MQIRKLRVSAFKTGLVMGLGAALIQAYFEIIPPPAYGICMVCHPKDLFNWLFDNILGTSWDQVAVSVQVPVLTVLGIVAGAFIAARTSGEFQLEPAREPIFHFITGLLVINFGLILGSCPIRILIVGSYGSLIGIAGFVFMAIGIGLGALWLRWNARRYVRRRQK